VRRWLFLAIVLVVLAVADRAAASYAESQIEGAARDQLFGIAAIDVQIHSFPFLGRLGAAGQVSRLDVRLDEVRGHGIDLESIRFDASDVRLERDALLHGDVHVTDVGSVHVTARISEAQVRSATHADVRLRDGRAEVVVGGKTLTATASVAAGRIRLSLDRLPALSVPLPDASLLPCDVQIRVEPGAVVASCTNDDLPSFIADAVVSVR
jgi:hypothetical protein